MWRFYWRVLLQMVKAARSSLYRVEAAVGVAGFVLLLCNQPIARKLLDWEGISPLWAVAPIAIVCGHLFLRGLYDHDCQREQLIAALQEENLGLRKNKPRLEFEYHRSKIITHPNGFVEFRILLWCRGPVRAQRVRVWLALLEQMEGHDTSHAGQFTCRLQVEGKKLGFDLQHGEPAAVRVIKAGKGAEWFLVDGYTNDPNDPREETFHTQAAKSRLTITASALDAIPDEKTFIVWQNAKGILQIKASARKPN